MSRVHCFRLVALVAKVTVELAFLVQMMSLSWPKLPQPTTLHNETHLMWHDVFSNILMMVIVDGDDDDYDDTINDHNQD